MFYGWAIGMFGALLSFLGFQSAGSYIVGVGIFGGFVGFIIHFFAMLEVKNNK